MMYSQYRIFNACTLSYSRTTLFMSKILVEILQSYLTSGLQLVFFLGGSAVAKPRCVASSLFLMINQGFRRYCQVNLLCPFRRFFEGGLPHPIPGNAASFPSITALKLVGGALV